MERDGKAGLLQAFRGEAPKLGERVYIAPGSQVIGPARLGDDVSVWPMAVIRCDVHAIEIGARTSIQDGVVLHVSHDGPYKPGGSPLHIGEDVTIGHSAVLHGCRIGARVLIGIRAVVLDDAVIPDEVMIGAGALVPPGKVLESGFLYVGQPARKARALTENERAYFAYSAAQYVKLKDLYLEEQAS